MAPLDAPVPETTLKPKKVPARYWRGLLALACFLLAAGVGILHLLNVSTSDAVLDGRRIVIRAQISGEVAGQLPEVGSVVNTGQIVALVQAPPGDERILQAAQAERMEVEAKIDALDLQREQLLAMQAQLGTEFTGYNNANVSTTAAQIDAAKANVQVAESDFRFATAEANRARQMRDTKSMGQSDIDRRLGDEVATLQRLTGAKADLARLTVEAGALAIGINTRDGDNNVPYSRQRLDEIAIKLGDIANERSILAATDISLIAEADRETKWLMSQSRSESLAPGQSVIWRRPVAVGTDVTKGDVLVELVDCSDMYVMARIPAEKASAIALRDPVDVVIAGYNHAIPGQVRIVRSLATSDTSGSAASGFVAPGEERLAEVEIAVELDAIPSSSGTFCGIGSGAKVRFPVRSIFSGLLPKF